jgi:hypothetical protein
MLDINELSINICILIVLYQLVCHFPALHKYDENIKFNIYRSLMCITFASMGINVLVNHFITGIQHPFSFKHNDMNEIYHLFTAYIIVDLVNMILLKSKRVDLYIHHIICIGGLLISHFTNKFGYIQSILLIGELLSVISGIDSIAIADNDMKLSLFCKKIRISIIKYVRYPIWIILFLFIVRYTDKVPNRLWYYLFTSSIVMVYMDNYWEKKCKNVIDKHEKV